MAEHSHREAGRRARTDPGAQGGAGRDILIFGSHTLWNDLLANDLVDELHLMIGAGVLGAGTPAFEGRPPISLRLVGTRTWDGSGIVLAQYAVEPAAV